MVVPVMKPTPPCWRGAKRHAEKEEAGGEVAAWLTVMMAAPFVVWLLLG